MLEGQLLYNGWQHPQLLEHTCITSYHVWDDHAVRRANQLDELHLEQKHQTSDVEYILAQEDKFAILLVF